VNPDGGVDLGVEGLQAPEWVALALLAALAFGLKRTEAGPGEALSAAVSAWFHCLIEQRDCPLTAVGLEKAGLCLMQPTGCLARWGDCLLRGACEGADPMDQVGLLPWLAVVGIPVGGVVFALLPPWVRRRRWAWPRRAFLSLHSPKEKAPPPGSSHSEPFPPPPPFWARVWIGTVLELLLLAIDVILILTALANAYAIFLAPDPLSRGVFVVNELLLIGAEGALIYLHLGILHWMVTGRWIGSWQDWKDWDFQP